MENKGLTWAEFVNADSRDHEEACLQRRGIGPPALKKKKEPHPFKLWVRPSGVLSGFFF